MESACPSSPPSSSGWGDQARTGGLADHLICASRYATAPVRPSPAETKESPPRILPSRLVVPAGAAGAHPARAWAQEPLPVPGSGFPFQLWPPRFLAADIPTPSCTHDRGCGGKREPTTQEANWARSEARVGPARALQKA